MRQKELRIALVCYGGISLAVYMHGISMEIWRLTRASRNFHAGVGEADSTDAIYREMLERIEGEHGLKLRVLPDIIAGASAGGINGVFLAQALSSGQSLEPLTDLWLKCADIDMLLDPDARPLSRFTKFWAQPLVWLALRRPGGPIDRTVSIPARKEVRMKLSRFIRARWFAPPFSGIGFSRLLYNALEAMAAAPAGPKLIPDSQPLDLYVTVTDFRGHTQRLQINSPMDAVETEHRLTIGFSLRPGISNQLAPPAELAFAARATASFPGAFPPFNIAEIDALLTEKGHHWPERSAFLQRAFPRHWAAGNAEQAVLIDGSVLANAPFAQAIEALKNRPAHRQIDRRFVYIDPRPEIGEGIDRSVATDVTGKRLPGFFSTIFAAMADIPREQPIRDNLEDIEKRTQRIMQMRAITDTLQSEVEDTVSRLFGRTLFLDRPTAKRLGIWRAKAQTRATQLAGFAYSAYGLLKLSTVIDDIVFALKRADGSGDNLYVRSLRLVVRRELIKEGLDRLTDDRGSATPAAIAFFRSHDIGFRIRRLRFLARKLADEMHRSTREPDEALVKMHDTVYACLAIYLDRESHDESGRDFSDIAAFAQTDPQRALQQLADRRNLRAADDFVDEAMAAGLSLLPKELRRPLLLAYLGFPFYDIATLPLLQGEGLNEFDPIKVDRISPNDAQSIRQGGAEKTLKGIELNTFGAFFSRAYRENDYLWGRLHGAERVIDLLASAVDGPTQFEDKAIAEFKRRIFLAICDDEQERLITDPELIPTIRSEIERTFAPKV